MIFLALGSPGIWIRGRWLHGGDGIGGGKRIFQSRLKRSFKLPETIRWARRQIVDVRLFRVRLFWLLVSRALGFGPLAARHHGHIAPLGDQRVARQFVHCDKAIVIKWIESGEQQTKGSLLPNRQDKDGYAEGPRAP